MNLKKVIALCLGLTLAMGVLFTGCGKKQEVKNQSENQQQETKEIKQKRPFKILMVSKAQYPNTPYKEQVLPKEAMKRTGIEYEAEFVPISEYSTKLNLYMASANPPDIFFSDDIAFWKEQGAIIPLGEMLEKYGSNMKKYVKPQAWQYTKYDGDIYAIPRGERTEDFNSNNVEGLLVRWDWVEKLGFAEKVMSEDFDLDQYHELLKAMTFNDPDGDGEDNTCGLANQIDQRKYSFKIIMGAFGLTEWMERDNKLVPMHMTQEYKQALELLKNWYAEGIIDPEFVVTKKKEFRERFIKGIVGSASTEMWNLNPNGPVIKGLKSSNPNAKLKMVIPPKGPEGYRGVEQRQPGAPGAEGYCMISSKTPNPELAVKLLDYVFSEEGAMLAQFGFEGKDYNYNKGTNRIEMITDQADVPKIYGNTRIMNVTDRRWSPKEVVEAVSMTSKYTLPGKFYGQVPAMAEYADLSKMISETLIKVIMGEAPLDEVDKVQERWMKNGGSEIIKQVNEKMNK